MGELALFPIANDWNRNLNRQRTQLGRHFPVAARTVAQPRDERHFIRAFDGERGRQGLLEFLLNAEHRHVARIIDKPFTLAHQQVMRFDEAQVPGEGRPRHLHDEHAAAAHARGVSDRQLQSLLSEVRAQVDRDCAAAARSGQPKLPECLTPR